jgi:hypothetical protein
MMSSISLLGLLIAIEAIPVGAYLRAQQFAYPFRFTPLLALAGLSVAAICIATTVISLRLAVRRMHELEE